MKRCVAKRENKIRANDHSPLQMRLLYFVGANNYLPAFLFLAILR